VVAATSAHISTHESGAIENSGHKVLTLPEVEGKIVLSDLRALLETFHSDPTKDHMVYPGMVYISHPTEYGTLYSKAELMALSALCHDYGMPLYLDGARLGYGLMSQNTDVTLQDIASLCDAFYIGGTKVGALFGEAVVFPKGAPAHFFTTIKQNGALLAKGRLLGIQFDTLFTDNLYFDISRHAIRMATKLQDGFRSRGYRLHLESPTNQIFVVLENSEMERLSEHVNFCFWEKADDTHSVVRFVTSWATKEENIDTLFSLLS